jgi:hypothetical protein
MPGFVVPGIDVFARSQGVDDRHTAGTLGRGGYFKFWLK